MNLKTKLACVAMSAICGCAENSSPGKSDSALTPALQHVEVSEVDFKTSKIKLFSGLLPVAGQPDHVIFGYQDKQTTFAYEILNDQFKERPDYAKIFANMPVQGAKGAHANLDTAELQQKVISANYWNLFRCRSVPGWQKLVDFAVRKKNFVYLTVLPTGYVRSDSSEYKRNRQFGTLIKFDIEKGLAVWAQPEVNFSWSNHDEDHIGIFSGSIEHRGAILQDNVITLLQHFKFHCTNRYHEKGFEADRRPMNFSTADSVITSFSADSTFITTEQLINADTEELVSLFAPKDQIVDVKMETIFISNHDPKPTEEILTQNFQFSSQFTSGGMK